MVIQNDFCEALEADEYVLGVRALSYSANLIEFYGHMGADFVWVDLESSGPSPWDCTTIENFTRAAEVSDTELLVRIPNGDPDLVRTLLDSGVRNLLIPRVESAHEMKKAIEASRFSYDNKTGQRGAGTVRSNQFGTADDYLVQEDEEIIIGAMVETKGAIENIDNILSVPELGFVFIGPGDLSIQLGHKGEKSHPEVENAIEMVEQKAIEKDVPLGCIANGGKQARKSIDRGYQVIRFLGEVEAFKETFEARVEQLKESNN